MSSTANDLPFDESQESESLVTTPEKMRFSLRLLIVFLASLVIRPWDFIPALATVKPVTLAILGILVATSIAGVRLKFWALPLSKSLFAIWVTMLVTTASSYWLGYSLDYSIKWFQFLLLFTFVGSLVVATDGLFALTRVLTGVGGVLALLAIYAKMTMQLSAEGRIEGVGDGFMSDPNELAQALVAVLPFAWWVFLRGRSAMERLIGVGFGLLLLAGVVITESRGALLSLITVGFVLLVVSRTSLVKKFGVVALVGLLGLAVIPSRAVDRYSTITTAAQTDESAQTRLAVWKAGGKMFSDHFFLGTGAGTFELVYGTKYMDRTYAGDKWYSAHNSVVEVAVELGVVGVIAWLWFTLVPFQLLWKSRSALIECHDDESPTRESLLVWLECMLASWAGFFVGAMFLSKGLDIPVILFVALAVAGSQLSRRWAETYFDAIDDAAAMDESGSQVIGNTGSV